MEEDAPVNAHQPALTPLQHSTSAPSPATKPKLALKLPPAPANLHYRPPLPSPAKAASAPLSAPAGRTAAAGSSRVRPAEQPILPAEFNQLRSPAAGTDARDGSQPESSAHCDASYVASPRHKVEAQSKAHVFASPHGSAFAEQSVQQHGADPAQEGKADAPLDQQQDESADGHAVKQESAGLAQHDDSFSLQHAEQQAMLPGRQPSLEQVGPRVSIPQ